MADRKSIRWLHGELPELVRSGVLTTDAAEALRRYYRVKEGAVRPSPGIVISAALGALLVGLGVILLFAHNWEDLGRPARTALSLAPLLLGQALAGWTILHRPRSAAWREGAAIFLTVAVGASIALVGQTYHISGDLPRFILTWSLLALPLVYLLDATLPAILYLVGVTFWARFTGFREEPGWLFWPLTAFALPCLWKIWREAPRGARFSWLGWTLALCLVAGAAFIPGGRAGLTPVILAGLFSVLYLTDRSLGEEPSVFRRPFAMTGAVGTAVLAVILSFTDAWPALFRFGAAEAGWKAFHNVALLVLLHIVALGLLILLFRRGIVSALPWGVAGPLTAAAWFASRGGAPPWALAVVFSLYLLVLGFTTLRGGLKEGRLAPVNGGLAVLSLLIGARFFDADLPFTLRGALFIVIGTVFLGVNLFVSRRRKETIR